MVMFIFKSGKFKRFFCQDYCSIKFRSSRKSKFTFSNNIVSKVLYIILETIIIEVTVYKIKIQEIKLNKKNLYLISGCIQTTYLIYMYLFCFEVATFKSKSIMLIIF